MKNRIHPCIWSNGQAKDMAELHGRAFSSHEIINENPVVVNYELEGWRLAGLNGGPMFRPNPSLSFFVKCNDLEEIEAKWKVFAEGGSALMPMEEYPFAERYGWIEDCYGVSWQLIIEPKHALQQKISPSFMFVGSQFGKAEEAMNVYAGIFDDSKVHEVALYPDSDEEQKGKVMRGQFRLLGQEFAAMDSSYDHQFNFSEGLSLVVSCETQEEIDRYWDALTTGGEEGQCGWLKDRFGVSWQIVPSKMGEWMADPEKTQRMMPAFMEMKKLDLEVLKNA